jgi:hypothetical protein
MTMAVKFKIGFTIDAETLFGIVSKFLPLENLAVEEVVERKERRPERPPAPLPPRRIKHLPARPKTVNRKMGEVDLHTGVNAIVMKLFSDGKPHRAIELKPLMKAQGYSDSGVGSRLDRLKFHNVVFQPELGFWQLTETYLKKDSAA